MKGRTWIAAVVLSLAAFTSLGGAQQLGMPPMIGYGHPMVYSPQTGYVPQMVAYQDELADSSFLGTEDTGQCGCNDCYGGYCCDAACGGCDAECGCCDAGYGGCDADCDACYADCDACYCEAGCGCGGCGCGGCGCAPTCAVWGDFLYLRPRAKELSYAVPINGAITAPVPGHPIQIGPVGVLDPDYSPGFRVGFAKFLNERVSMGAQYTWYESNTEDALSVNSPYVLRSLVRHPGPAAAPTDFLDAQAAYDIDFQIVDVDYRLVLLALPRGEVTLVGGACYLHEEQTFRSRFSVSGVESVDTDIVFDGGGIRIGLEGERRSSCGCLVYGRSSARFAAGDFRCSYLEGTGTDRVIVNTNWSAGRVVSLLDLELGIGWVSSQGCVRLSAGYMFNTWLNMINTDNWIQAVQDNDFVDIDGDLTFDGLVARAEIRW